MCSAGKISTAARLVFGIRTDDPELTNMIVRRLSLEYGAVVAHETIHSLPHKDHGGSANEVRPKTWVALAEPIDPVRLVRIKHHARQVETLYSEAPVPARVELDPLYVDDTRVVRATTKEAPNRIYLGSGIYGELLLHRLQAGNFTPMSWTHLEDTDSDLRAFFDRVRDDWQQEKNMASIEPAR